VTPSARGSGKARVLHVANQIPPHTGGLETVVAAETHRLRDRGWDVSVLSSADTQAPGVRDEDGVRTVRLRGWNGLEERFGVPFNVFSPRALLAMRAEVRRAELVHIHDVIYLISWAAALWCRLERTPYVVHRHVGVVHHPSVLVRLAQWLVLGSIARAVLAHAAAVLPIDEHIATGLRASVREAARIEVLGNGVDASRFRPASPDERAHARRAHGLPLDRPLALFVGRNVPKKGFATVAQAAGDDYDLVFVGGPRPAGVDDPRLHFLGELPPGVMPDVYGCADVMVIASVGECPLTVLEAMSCGLPLLVNDDPVLHSPWTAGPGVRFVDMAGGQLPEALRELVSDPDEMRRLGAEAHGYVRSAFTWETHVDRLEAIYERQLSRPPAAGRNKF
jgi:rhamnosyl/mannosyltransferase